jgi:outer membrane murein-binding lipoprotein Lpp
MRCREGSSNRRDGAPRTLPGRLLVAIAATALLAVGCGQDAKLQPASPSQSQVETIEEKCAELNDLLKAAIEDYEAGLGDDSTLQERLDFESELLNVLDYLDDQMKDLDCPQWHERNDP